MINGDSDGGHHNLFFDAVIFWIHDRRNSLSVGGCLLGARIASRFRSPVTMAQRTTHRPRLEYGALDRLAIRIGNLYRKRQRLLRHGFNAWWSLGRRRIGSGRRITPGRGED